MAATEAATVAATEAATMAATEAVTVAATEAATMAATEAATAAATEAATEAATAAVAEAASAALAGRAGAGPVAATKPPQRLLAATAATQAPEVLEGSSVTTAKAPDLAAGTGVTILRGSAVGPRKMRSSGTGKRLRVVGGRRIWTIDPATKAVRSCAVRKTGIVGVRAIRCTQGSIGRYRRGFGRSFKP
jgi:hypothetical protein